MELTVGIGECMTSHVEENKIKTFALASCVAVTAYCPVKKASGMIHIVLPHHYSNEDRIERPSYFADTGVPLLINLMCTRYNCNKNDLVIEIYGGAESKSYFDIYHIGSKNIEAVKNELYKIGLHIKNEELRGCNSRTLIMEVGTGKIEVYLNPIP